MEALIRVLCLLFGFCLGAKLVFAIVDDTLYKTDKTLWQCTKSIVVSADLPRKEECTQYTRKDKP